MPPFRPIGSDWTDILPRRDHRNSHPSGLLSLLPIELAILHCKTLALTVFDGRHNENEERWFTLGMANGQLLAVSHTVTDVGDHSVEVRIISARPATRNERRQYENEPQ